MDKQHSLDRPARDLRQFKAKASLVNKNTYGILDTREIINFLKLWTNPLPTDLAGSSIEKIYFFPANLECAALSAKVIETLGSPFNKAIARYFGHIDPDTIQSVYIQSKGELKELAVLVDHTMYHHERGELVFAFKIKRKVRNVWSLTKSWTLICEDGEKNTFFGSFSEGKLKTGPVVYTIIDDVTFVSNMHTHGYELAHYAHVHWDKLSDRPLARRAVTDYTEHMGDRLDDLPSYTFIIGEYQISDIKFVDFGGTSQKDRERALLYASIPCSPNEKKSFQQFQKQLQVKFMNDLIMNRELALLGLKEKKMEETDHESGGRDDSVMTDSTQSTSTSMAQSSSGASI